MFPAGNKAKRLSSVNHTIKTKDMLFMCNGIFWILVSPIPKLWVLNFEKCWSNIKLNLLKLAIIKSPINKVDCKICVITKSFIPTRFSITWYWSNQRMHFLIMKWKELLTFNPQSSKPFQINQPKSNLFVSIRSREFASSYLTYRNNLVTVFNRMNLGKDAGITNFPEEHFIGYCCEPLTL